MPRGADSASEPFSGLLLRYRGRTRLTQRELAARVGVSRRVEQDWEAGVNVPSADHLQALIAVLFEAGGLRAGREADDAHALWAAALGEFTSRVRRSLDEEWLAEVLAHDAPASATAGRAAQIVEARRQDWGEAPDIVGFVGRAHELETCRTWLFDESCRLVAVLGMGGIGKTTLAAQLAQDVAPAFQTLYWRSLCDAPPAMEWLAGAIGFLSEHQLVPPASESERLSALLQLLRERRSLLVLDNFETLLESGGYRPDSASYGRLLQAIGGGRHQSCLLLTSREAPPELATVSTAPVRTVELGGLAPAEGRVLLAHNQLTGDSEQWVSLTAQFGGNGLALKVVGERIRQLFGGDIGAFLAEESGSGSVFGDIRRLLREQIERGGALQQEVLRVLAMEREPVRISELLAVLGRRVARGAALDAVEALRRRSLIEQTETGGSTAFTLQPVVLEYVTDRLVEDVSEEIIGGASQLLAARPLIRAQAKEYVRQAQERLIGAPILQRLNPRSASSAGQGAQLGEGGTEQHLRALLEGWRSRPPDEQGYGPGNVINLLRLQRRGNLRAIDFSRLSVRHAYLAGVEAQGASLAGADLLESMLAEAFPPPLRVTLSGDGALMALGTSTGEVWVYRVADRAPVLAIQAHAGAVWGVALSADGRLLATGSDDGTARVWEPASGRELATMQGHTSAVRGVALSADGRFVASASADGTVRLWDVESGRALQTLHGHSGTVTGVALSLDMRLLASGGDDGTARIWELPSGRALATLRGGTNAVWGVALSADARRLATGSVDGAVHVWDVESGRALATLRGHTSAVWAVALSSDGRRLASGSADSTVRLWEVPSGRAEAILQGHTSMVMGVTISHDGGLVASSSADGTVRLWEPPSGRILATLEGQSRAVFSVSLTADGRFLCTGHGDGTARVWEAASGQLLATLRGHTGAIRVVVSRDGRLVASCGADATVRLWDLPSGRLLETLLGHTSAVIDVALAEDRRLLASGSADGTLRLWEVPSGRALAVMRGHGNPVRGVALSLEGRLLASGGADGTVRLWDLPSGRAVATLRGHTSGVWSVALSADPRSAGHGGQLLASGSDDGTVRLWDVPGAGLLATLLGHTSTVMRVALSVDGRVLATGSGDGTIRLWDVPSGRAMATLQGHSSTVFGVSLSADGALLASGSGDGTVKLWETGGGTCVATFRTELCYEGLNITGITGVSTAQRTALLALGAVEQPMVDTAAPTIAELPRLEDKPVK